MRRTKPIRICTTLLGAATALTVQAAQRDWTFAGTSTTVPASWDVDTNWSSAPSWDGTDNLVLGNVIPANRVHALDGDRDAADLAVATGKRYTLTPGADTLDARLILRSGNLTVDGMGVNYVRPLNTRAITTQVGTGSTPVTDAVWTLNNATYLGNADLGAVAGVAGTRVTLAGSGMHAIFWTNSPSYFGDWDLTLSPVGSPLKYKAKVQAEDSHALGHGTVRALADKNYLHFNTGANNTTPMAVTEHDFALDLQAFTAIAIGYGSGAYQHLTAVLHGRVTGDANLELGYFGDIGTSFYRGGTLVLTHPDNTLSGTVTIVAGKLRVDGGWTGAGDIGMATSIAVADPSLLPRIEGSGTIGMEPDKVVNADGVNAANLVGVAPGTDGTVGTLTLGTPGNNNTLRFQDSVRLMIDLSGTERGRSDTLAVRGTLQLVDGKDDQVLQLQRIDGDALNGTYTLATFDRMVGTFDAVYYGGELVADPTAKNGVGGTHQLVYNETSLVLLAAPPGGTVVVVQ